MIIARSIVVSILSTAALTAQIVTVAGSLSSPFIAEARVGTQISSVTQPAGQIVPTLQLGANVAPGPLGFAHLGMRIGPISGRPNSYEVRSGGASSTVAGVTSSTSTGLVDLLVTVQATSPALANLVVEREVTGEAGSALPIMRVDVGDNGTFEILEYSNPGAGVNQLQLGPTPLAVRVRFQADSTGGVLNANLRLQFVPENNLTISPLIAGCSNDFLFAEPAFQGGGIEIIASPVQYGDLTVGVIGVGVQPAIVPSLLPGCVLMPTPDVLLLMDSNINYSVPLPPSVRPVTFGVQGVVLPQSALGSWSGFFTTTPGFRVVAN